MGVLSIKAFDEKYVARVHLYKPMLGHRDACFSCQGKRCRFPSNHVVLIGG